MFRQSNSSRLSHKSIFHVISFFIALDPWVILKKGLIYTDAFFDDKMTRTRDYLGLQARKENSSFCIKKINQLNFRARMVIWYLNQWQGIFRQQKSHCWFLKSRAFHASAFCLVQSIVIQLGVTDPAVPKYSNNKSKARQTKLSLRQD